jgi:uncharacterized protein (DUF488 family)
MGGDSPVMTVGYEGADPDRLIAALRAAGARTLIDVRAVPASRKPGLSKRALAAAVEHAGLAYTHLVGLGNPKAGRDAGKAGDRATFHRIFSAHMKTGAAEAALAQAAEIAAAGPVCLMCYERDPKSCHRTIVADRSADMLGTGVRHLPRDLD